MRPLKPGGWALPLLCLLLLTGAATLAAAVQVHLMQRSRSLHSRWASLQAHAAAEGQLRLALALLDEAQTVDEGCRVMPTAPLGSTLSTGPTTSASSPQGPEFADRFMRHGSTIGCSLNLDAPGGRQAWRCDCRLDGTPLVLPPQGPRPPDPQGLAPAPVTGPRVVLTGVQVSESPSGMRLVARACLPQVEPLPSGSACTLEELLAGSVTGVQETVAVRVRRDTRGIWREVAGSWTDAP